MPFVTHLPEQTHSVTLLLQRAHDGDKEALDQVFRQTYDELWRIAQRLVASARPNADLQATALVNAACERLLGENRLDANCRRHFFFMLSRAMHDVLVRHARHDGAAKRGGGQRRVPLVEVGSEADSMTLPILELHAALDALRAADADAAQVVTLCYFGGRTIREAAEILGCSFSTARGNLDYAKAWLRSRLEGTEHGDS